MKLTYKTYLETAEVIGKLLRTELVDDFSDAIIIANMKDGIAKVEELYGKAAKALNLKYSKLAETNKADHIVKFKLVGDEAKEVKPFNTEEERENFEIELQELLDTECPIDIQILPLKKETVELLWKGTVDYKEVEGKQVKVGKKDCFNASDLNSLVRLELFVQGDA